jgi:glycosyltransferase involved in cell wall biosynthesis
VGKPSDLAVQILDRARGAPSFYDAMDDVAWFYEGRSRASMARQEIAVAVRVDRVWAASSALERRWRRGARFCVRVPNACAPEDLPSPGARPPARDRRAFGYVGTLARWFDWDFTRAVAEAFPDRPVDLIGPMYERPSGRLPDNVRLHPPRAAREALAAMGRFAVGLIPFRAGPLTEAADPVKYYEYAALGLPVLSTRVGEMARREGCPGVFLAEGPAEAAVRAREALAATPVEDLRAFQAVHSWEARFDAAGLFS